ncbi:hypothetical protein Maqu_4218 (plasmid) [Marinobacter nauticus VT8]|uniref:Uncharacterized protein n=1 Tax=Marinobacter nauticus (strain ATCC 700491 / DSM 11845 / VT8) TaxID=351348 RepID=A1U7V0_MARN8|nr:hypothetical protein Maqu_4218 [Marinobacter nauticus VT8]
MAVTSSNFSVKRYPHPMHRGTLTGDSKTGPRNHSFALNQSRFAGSMAGFTMLLLARFAADDFSPPLQQRPAQLSVNASQEYTHIEMFAFRYGHCRCTRELCNEVPEAFFKRFRFPTHSHERKIIQICRFL